MTGAISFHSVQDQTNDRVLMNPQTTMSGRASLDDLASPLSRLKVQPIPSEFGVNYATTTAGPARFVLQDPGVTTGSRQETPRAVQIPNAHASSSGSSQGLDFNLFRSSTISTVSSNSSAYDDDRSLYSSPDSPERFHFPPHSGLPDGPSTPKAVPPHFQVLSRPQTRTPTSEVQHDHGYFSLDLPASTSAKRSDGPQTQVAEVESAGDAASVYGEQGEWGEDEATYEWLDTDAQADDNVGNSQPPGRIAMIRAASGGSMRLKKNRPLVLPTRAAPPPPPEAISAPMPLGMRSREAGARTISSPSTPSSWHHPPAAAKARSHEPLDPHRRPPPEALQLASRSVSLKDDRSSPTTSDNRSSTPTQRSHDVAAAHQSVAWSFYDLEGNATPGPSTPQGSELAFPKGRYTKLLPTQGEHGAAQRDSGPEPKTAGNFLRSGIDAKAQGELARSAYFFMKAAEGGSASGRIYYGLALRHGLGVAKDEKKGFNELRRACDESLADGALDESSSQWMDTKQRVDLNRDIAFAICEVANCFLDGVGVRKSPEIAVTYLRFAAKLGDVQSQEQLGYFLTKGKGVKKDLKEAAHWYRQAIAEGSPNTFGMAWIYKAKYL